MTTIDNTTICDYCADDYNQAQIIRLYGEEFSNYAERNTNNAICAICDLPCARCKF